MVVARILAMSLRIRVSQASLLVDVSRLKHDRTLLHTLTLADARMVRVMGRGSGAAYSAAWR
jgi:hypothetical protein